MKNAITLPVNFANGSRRQVDIYADSPRGSHYSLKIGGDNAGSFTFTHDKNDWNYLGELGREEQVQLAGFIQNYTDDDWEN